MIVFSYGTRPEYIKVNPLIQEFKKQGLPYKVLFTGQHTDLVKSTEIDFIFSIDDQKADNRLSQIFINILEQFEKLPLEVISGILVQGDTTSAFAVAVAAFNYKIPVIHLEAGLRTYDAFNPYPEEFNRKSIAALATVHLCPTLSSEDNLLKEGITDNVHRVGNSVLDNLVNIPTSSSNKVIVTLHRREKHNELHHWFEEIDLLAKENPQLSFILPAHPNPNVQKHLHLLENVKVVKPYDHEEFLTELASCKAIITDSGGIQEEAAFFKKPCIVCRDYTERTEGLDTLAFLCPSYENLKKIFDQSINLDLNDVECPYGDGKTSSKAAKILKNTFFLQGE